MWDGRGVYLSIRHAASRVWGTRMVTWTGDVGWSLRRDGTRYWDVVRIGVVADLVVGGRRRNQGSFVPVLRLVLS